MERTPDDIERDTELETDDDETGERIATPDDTESDDQTDANEHSSERTEPGDDPNP